MKRIFWTGLICSVLLFTYLLQLNEFDELKIEKGIKKVDIVDYSASSNYIYTITRRGLKPYGSYLKFYSRDGELLYESNIEEVRPYKIESGNIGGEIIALGVVKKSPLHSELLSRIFFYKFDGVGLIPVYRASRLSHYHSDFTLYDIDGDGEDELISVEDVGREVAAYKWKSFGFEKMYSGFPKYPVSKIIIDDGLVVKGYKNYRVLFNKSGELKLEEL